MLTVRYDRGAASYHITRTHARRNDACEVVPAAELEAYLRRTKVSLVAFMAGFHQQCWPGACPQCL